jgi:hypothetical protein
MAAGYGLEAGKWSAREYPAVPLECDGLGQPARRHGHGGAVPPFDRRYARQFGDFEVAEVGWRAPLGRPRHGRTRAAMTMISLEQVLWARWRALVAGR